MPPTRTKSTELSRDDRIRCLTLREAGFTYQKIADQLKITVRQVRYAIKSDHPTPSKRTGRPTTVTNDQIDEIIRYISESRERRRISYLELADTFKHFGVKEWAIQGALERRGYKRYIARSKPPLTPHNKRKRLEWAREHLLWPRQQWDSILWSDETWVTGKKHRRVYVTRTKEEEFEDTCLRDRKRQYIGWMFWGSFYGSIKAGSVFWEKKWGTITQHTYKEHIIPLLVETTTEHSGLLFMQDNAPAHAAKSVIQELKRLGITVMTWPAYSPDLNPIETLWNWMKDWIHWHYTEDQLKNSYDKLKQAVYNAWNAIPESLLASIIDTMHERCQDVINADGGHTKW